MAVFNWVIKKGLSEKWLLKQDQNEKYHWANVTQDISVAKKDFLLKHLLILIFASEQLLLDSSNQDVWNCPTGPGPGGAIHVHEHSWDLHQLPVGPRPAPGLPGDTEVCGGQATPGDREPKTGTKCKTVFQMSPRQSLYPGTGNSSFQTPCLASVLSKSVGSQSLRDSW